MTGEKASRSARVAVDSVRIRELMKSRRVSAQVLGDYMGYSGEYIKRCIWGREMPPLMIQMLAKYFRVSEDELRA